MKLYTEEQLREAIELAREKYQSDMMLSTNGIMLQFTPIELPTEDDAEKSYYEQLEQRREVAKNFKGQVAGRHPDMFIGNEMQNMVRGYLECLQCMRDKIKGGEQ